MFLISDLSHSIFIYVNLIHKFRTLRERWYAITFNNIVIYPITIYIREFHIVLLNIYFSNLAKNFLESNDQIVLIFYHCRYKTVYRFNKFKTFITGYSWNNIIKI
jgi:hypothetical protein